jgi:8-oxo-dGTP pyrophosphatase MutT (NUDIX family)
MIFELREALSRYSPAPIISHDETLASVLIPVFENQTGPHIVLTKRTTKVKYHRGEISFPGGMYEDSDGHSMKTAIRECHEEIGVKPDDIEIIGRLDDEKTLTGFIITPYVGLIPYPYDFKPNPGEVNYLIYLPVDYLLHSRPSAEMAEHAGRKERVSAIYYNNERIWGATCRILLKLKGIIQGE